MKSTFFAVAISSLLILGTSAFAQEGKHETVRKQRMQRQQKRIHKGVEEGSLTKKEAAKLEVKEGALAREARKDRIDGGGMTAKEKAKINHKQNKLSEEIYKEKHDAQKRP